MKKIRSRFFQRPDTKIGWWSGILSILAVIATVAINFDIFTSRQIPEKTFLLLLSAINSIMLASIFGSIVLGLIGVINKRERSWMVWLFIFPSLYLVLLAIPRCIKLVDNFDLQKTVAPTLDVDMERVPIILDDDGSPDGTTALLYLLSDPRAEVVAVSVSYGEAHPRVYIQHLGRILEQYGYGNIPLGAGQDAPLGGNNAFPEFIREASDRFWGFASKSFETSYTIQDSAQLIVETILTSEEPVTLLVSGALTNLAQALRIEPEIKNNIAAVYIMGGAVYVPGNIKGLLPESENMYAEWNIYTDPLAAAEVFSSGLSLYLVPLDATNQVILTRLDIRSWRKGGSIPNFAADFYETRMNDWGRDQIEMWDLVTAEIMMNPLHCKFTPMKLVVVTNEGDAEGQTKAVEGEANFNICLKPDSDAIKSNLEEVFGSRKED